MTETSLPWNGQSVGDAGPYSDANWWTSWAAMFHAHARGTGYGSRGPIIDSGNAPDVGLQVQATSPASSDIEVLPGACVIDGLLYLNDDTEELSIAANASGNPRIDTVIVRKDHTAQTARLVVKQGTPAATPAPPALTQTAGSMWEVPLADIAVANGFLTLSDADITPRQEWANAADGIYLKDLLNNSGDTLETGHVVVLDTSADRAVDVDTEGPDVTPLGVWVGRTQNGDYGRVLNRGIGLVRVDGAVSRGDVLVMSASNAGQASVRPSTGASAIIGRTLTATAGAGLVLAMIDVSVAQVPNLKVRVKKGANQAIPAGNERTVAWDGTIDFDTGGFFDQGTDDEKFYAPVTGIYEIQVILVGQPAPKLYVNGATNIANNASSGNMGFIHITYPLTAGQYITVGANNGNVSSQNITGNAQTVFSMTLKEQS